MYDVTSWRLRCKEPWRRAVGDRLEKCKSQTGNKGKVTKMEVLRGNDGTKSERNMREQALRRGAERDVSDRGKAYDCSDMVD